jgi:hypothetical protein
VGAWDVPVVGCQRGGGCRAWDAQAEQTRGNIAPRISIIATQGIAARACAAAQAVAAPRARGTWQAYRRKNIKGTKAKSITGSEGGGVKMIMVSAIIIRHEK